MYVICMQYVLYILFMQSWKRQIRALGAKIKNKKSLCEDSQRKISLWKFAGPDSSEGFSLNLCTGENPLYRPYRAEILCDACAESPLSVTFLQRTSTQNRTTL